MPTAGPDDDDASADTPPVPASRLLWTAAIGSFLAYAALNVFLAARTGKTDFAELLGRAVGSSIWPLGAVAVASIWKKNRTQRTRVKVLLIASLALILLALLAFLTVGGYAEYRQHLLDR